MKAWKRIQPTIVSKIGWRTIVSKTFELPSGAVHNFETIEAEGAVYVATIALTADHKVIVARQFRPGPEAFMNDLPGGGMEQDEEPEAAARRELMEETGYEPAAMELLGTNRRDSYQNGTWYYFVGTGCSLVAGGQHPEPTEFVDVRLITIDELIEDAKHDRMTDPAAVLMAYDKLRELQRGQA